MLRIGTRTRWGEIASVGITRGERYYWMVSKHGTVSMMPVGIVEWSKNGNWPVELGRCRQGRKDET